MPTKNGTFRVLLVDDEPDITAVLKMGLQRHDFDVVTYNDPTKALADLSQTVTTFTC